MRALVTGATGFVGSHLARELVEHGATVRCLARASSALDNVDGLDVEVVRGDLTRYDQVLAAVRGCDRVFHCAADYRLWVREPRAMFAANVDGTEHVLRAAASCGVERVVYTSTVGALGLEPDGRPADETTPVTAAAMIGPYKRSKYEAERVAEAWAARGLGVVIVNPSTPVGERDVKPTATGQLIVDFLRRRMPAYVDTGLNLIDVRDVARGHLLAAERGRPGAKYILGSTNLTLKEILDRLAALTGIPAPRVRLPHWLPFTFSALDTALRRPFGRAPRVPLDAVRMARKRMFFDAGRAVRELGLPQHPIDDALARAVCWFRDHGYAPASAGRRSA
jgi:dihydroflavonol-4-reductase